MANLVSPGVSVTITDESFFISNQASTVPLFFIATAAEKFQPDGISPAVGTYESNVIRTVTSLKQSTQLYGVPKFLETSGGAAQHGDARNEYGLLALNQYLAVGRQAYVIRANINLNDSLTAIRLMWTTKMQESSYLLENLATAYLAEFNLTNNFIPSSVGYKSTINQTTLLLLAASATASIWANSTFSPANIDFTSNHTTVPFNVYASGYSAASTGTYLGLTGMAAAWVTAASGSVVTTEWTASEASTMLLDAASLFKFTQQFLNDTSLGANDAARRLAIVTKLQEVINGNNDIRSELYQYNLIACPGYHECEAALIALSTSIMDEAFVVSDVPMDKDPTTAVAWQGLSAAHNRSAALYYPPCMTSNLDGKNVLGAASGVAIATMTYSDQVSAIWFAPAGVRRGQITSGVFDVGYVSGTLGTATTFNPVALNNGQRDDLYKYPTNINPIVNFIGQGIIMWGQKTQQSTPSALDRINVVRMLMYIKRQLRKGSMSFIFEPNDQLTRDNLKATVDGFLSTLVIGRGLYDYATVCDASNNTPYVIDNNMLIIDVALKATKSVEFIYIPIRVVNTGASLSA